MGWEWGTHLMRVGASPLAAVAICLISMICTVGLLGSASRKMFWMHGVSMFAAIVARRSEFGEPRTSRANDSRELIHMKKQT